MEFTKVSQTTFNELQLEAGVVLNQFDPANPSVADANIVCATTGGVNATCEPTYTDFGEDIDNVPNNTKELKRIESWECKLAFTALNATKEVIQLSLGAASVTGGTGTAPSKIEPNVEIKSADFKNIWWVGDRSDGGMVAIKLVNALSTGGFNLQTAKAGKGELSVELTGHVSISDTDTVPMEFYVSDGETGETGETGA